MIQNVKIQTTSGVFLLCSFSSVFADVENKTKEAVKTVTSEHMINWFIALIIVLLIFFICIWVLRKSGALALNSKKNMRVIAGLSLGMREKLLLVQVGEKQLVLGVTPGRINKLLTLEGNEQIYRDQSDNKSTENDFANKLKKALMGSQNE